MSDIHIHRQPWLLILAVTSSLIVIVFLYVRGWLRLRTASGTEASLLRLAAFLFGVATVWTTTASPLATLDHQSLTLHMLKHLLLMTVAAPLLLAGSSASVLARGLPKRFIHENTLFIGRNTNRFEFRHSDLVLCWLAGTATVIGWHLPAAFQLGMRSRWAHGIEDMSFLLAGLLFWWPIARSWSSRISEPRWNLAFYLFLATLPCDVLSAFLVFCNRVVYSHYLSTARVLGISPLHDQENAGAFMWVWITFIYLVPAVVITLQMLSPSARTLNAASEDSRIL
jgi:putative membrane protein